MVSLPSQKSILGKGKRHRRRRGRRTLTILLLRRDHGPRVYVGQHDEYSHQLRSLTCKHCLRGINEDMGQRKKRTTKRRAYAKIPKCQDRTAADAEYQDFPEEKIWTPDRATNEWVPAYTMTARGILTYVQQSQGISHREAAENSCTGYADQYVSNILHNSEYLPEVALKMLMSKQLPPKLTMKWAQADIELFSKGFAKHGKDFSKIRREFLPEKDTNEVVEFYYTWKWTKQGQEHVQKPRRRRLTTQKEPPVLPADLILGPSSSPKVVTRSISAANGYVIQKESPGDS